MPTLHITRGLPGSGKTYFAGSWTADDPAQRVRVNRDDLRAMLDDGRFIKGVTEKRVIAVRNAAILTLLRRGIDVVCDDTNLPNRTISDLTRIAQRAGAAIEVHDFTAASLETCVARDTARQDRTVGAEKIRDLHARYIAGRPSPLPIPDPPTATPQDRRYEPKPGAARAVLCDIDGTVALMSTRSPYDETTVAERAKAKEFMSRGWRDKPAEVLR